MLILFVQLEVLINIYITVMVQNVVQGHTPLEGLLVVPSKKGCLTTAGQGKQIHPLMENIWTSWKENADGRRIWLSLMLQPQGPLMLCTMLIFQRRWDSYPQMKSCILIQGLRHLSAHWLTSPLSSYTSLGCPWQSLGMYKSSLVHMKAKSEPNAILSTLINNFFIYTIML